MSFTAWWLDAVRLAQLGDSAHLKPHCDLKFESELPPRMIPVIELVKSSSFLQRHKAVVT